MWCAIGIAFEGNGRHRNDGVFGKPLFQIVILRLALSEVEPPAVVMDHDADVIRVVERCRVAIERRIVEVPLRRSELPDKLRKVVPVFRVTGSASPSGEMILVPPYVVRPPVQENYRRVIGRAVFSISNVQESGIDPLQ